MPNLPLPSPRASGAPTQTDRVEATSSDVKRAQAATGRESISVRRGSTVWRVAAAWQELLLGEGSPDWFALEGDCRARRLKSGHRRGVWRVQLEDRRLFVKVRRCPRLSFRERARQVFRSTAAEREWRTGWVAAERGAPVVRFLALGTRGGSKPGTVLISEAWPRSAPLSVVWRKYREGSSSQNRTARNEIIEAVAKGYAGFHKAGVYHEDNHPQNILIRRRGGRLESLLVDLVAARVRRGTRTAGLVLALAQLEHHFQRVAARTDRLRFLYRYLEVCKGGAERAEVRTLTRRVFTARGAHAADLARRRDRRISRNGKYFASFNLGGRRATVVLKLGRRHVFPEPDVPDRSVDDWKRVVGLLGTTAGHSAAHFAQWAPLESGLEVCENRPMSLWRRVLWTFGGSPGRLFFVRCHQLRHRDIRAHLPLAVVAQRGSMGLTAREWLIVAARREPPIDSR